MELFGGIAVKKPALSKKNIKDRLKFAREHINWPLRQWYTGIEFYGQTKPSWCTRRKRLSSLTIRHKSHSFFRQIKTRNFLQKFVEDIWIGKKLPVQAASNLQTLFR